MKKYIINLIILLTSSHLTFSQINSVSNLQNFYEGRSEIFFVGSPSNIISSPIGDNIIWDYSYLKTYTAMEQPEAVVTYVKNTVNSRLSDTLLRDSVYINPKYNIDIPSAYTFLRSDNNYSYMDGLYGQFNYNGNPAQATFVASDPLYTLYNGSSYDTSITDMFSGTIYLPNGIKTSLDGTSLYRIRSRGILQLPYDTVGDQNFPVTLIEREDSAMSGVIPFFNMRITIKTKELLFFNLGNSNTTNFPLLRIIEYDFNGDINRYIFSHYKLDSTGASVNRTSLSEHSYQLYPNPAKQHTKVLLENNYGATKASINVFNTLGQSVLHQDYNIVQGENAFTLSTKVLPKGIYFVTLEIQKNNGIKSRTKSLVIE